ncbi:MAG: S8 family serine peptidase [Bacteroidetes bacterium]|nr:S8 family serine peptidase [Bacteroidota bacterium]
MKKFSHVLLFVLMFSLAFTSLDAESPDRNDGPDRNTLTSTDILPDVIVIKFRPRVHFNSGTDRLGISSLDPVLSRIGATAVQPISTLKETPLQKAGRPAYNYDRMVTVRYTSGDHPELLAHEISGDPNVEYAEPYYVFPVHHAPNDPRLNQQWAVNVMKLRDAWDITTGDSSIVIGIVDTGVDWSHEDLALNIHINQGEWGVNGELSNNGIDDDNNGKIDDWRGWDYFGNGSLQSPRPNNDPMDGSLGHGTSTGGCAAARTNNELGIAGSSYRSKILAVKASPDQTAGIIGYEAIVYAAQMGSRVINCSWGGTGSRSQAIQDLIHDVTETGSLVVSSSGNNPLDNDYVPHWPSSFSRVLNVGSVESNGSASNWCTYGTSVHTYAPGSRILTARNKGGYTSPTGTSFSAPLAAGVAALVFAIHPDWTPDQVATQLRVTSDPFDTPVTSKRYGRLNAFKAVTLNSTLSDIPGVRLRDFDYVFQGGGNSFTGPGQVARVTVEIENVLAPTSEAAMAYVDIDDPSLSALTTDFPLGAMETFDRTTIIFDVVLSENPSSSEGYLPIRIRIEDGEYVDFLLGRIPIYLDDAWHTSMSFGAPYFTSINTASNTSVWANASVQNQDIIVRTVNGGSSWGNASGSGYPSGKGVYCVAAVSPSIALVGTGPSNGAAEIFRTTNGGSNWSGTSVSDITGFVNWIHMYDAQNGILQGDPRNNIWGIATTNDGGATWTPIPTPLTSATGENGWNNSYAAFGNTIWFGTNNSRIYRSRDRGQNWTVIPTPSKHSVDLVFADSERGMIRFTTQTDLGGSNMLVVTEDGGDTWREISTVTLTTGGSIEAEPDGKRFWLIQNNNAWVTTDLGETWQVQATPGSFDPITCSAAASSSTRTDIYAAGLNLFKFSSDVDPYGTSNLGHVNNQRDFRLDYLYPNPVSTRSANGVTLGFTFDAVMTTQIAVYDNLGRLVLTQDAGRLGIGTHSLHIDTSVLPVGNYHVHLLAGERAAVSPLLVIH